MSKINRPKSWSEVCKIERISEEIPFDVSKMPIDMGNYLVAAYKLPYIVKAINGDWKPDFSKGNNQYKWYLWWRVVGDVSSGSALRFHFADYGYAVTFTYSGLRLLFESEAAGKFCAETFFDVWFDFIMYNNKAKEGQIIGGCSMNISNSIINTKVLNNGEIIRDKNKCRIYLYNDPHSNTSKKLWSLVDPNLTLDYVVSNNIGGNDIMIIWEQENGDIETVILNSKN